MKAYGMNKRAAMDDDADGNTVNGHPTASSGNTRSLRNGKRAAARRPHKRRARAEGRREIARSGEA